MIGSITLLPDAKGLIEAADARCQKTLMGVVIDIYSEHAVGDVNLNVAAMSELVENEIIRWETLMENANANSAAAPVAAVATRACCIS